jgi:hypothetical protein
MPLPEPERKIITLVSRRFAEARTPTERKEVLSLFKPYGPNAVQRLVYLNVLQELMLNQRLIPRPVAFHLCGIEKLRQQAKSTFQGLVTVLQHMYDNARNTTACNTEVLLYDTERYWPDGYENPLLFWLGLYQCSQVGLVGGWLWEKDPTEVQQLFVNDGVMGIDTAAAYWEDYIEKESNRIELLYRKTNAERFLQAVSDLEQGQPGSGVRPLQWNSAAEELGFSQDERSWILRYLMAEGLLVKKGASDAITTTRRGFSELHSLNLPIGNEEPTTMQSNSEPLNESDELLVFISHSSKDQELALALIELLKNGLGILPHQIRCSSVDGYRLPIGVNTETQLRAEVNAAKVVIGLITRNSLVSAFVMFELGARWGASQFLAPLLAGVTPLELKGPLALLNSLSANSDSQLHQLLENVSTRLGIKSRNNPSSYTKYISTVKQLSEELLEQNARLPDAARPEPEKKTSKSL